MHLLSRYLLRQLAAPFVFALAALTSLMLLSQIAKKFGALVGKGLPWGVIAEVFALSLPFIVAMTLPMAVLLAVLYAFSHLAADNEITAMRASGISVYQILVPVLAWGVFMSAFNFAFVDQVLPRTNARLRGLLIDIGRKKPTLELREQVINEVPPSQYFLRAGRIDGATGRLKDITIYDMGGETSRRIIYADSGRMAYNEGRTDLNLELFDGSIHQYRPADPLAFQLTFYRVNNIRVKDVYDELVRNSSETVRGDREMSTCEMLSVIQEAHTDRRSAGRDRQELLGADLRALLHLPPAGPARPDSIKEHLPAYCGWIDRLQMAFSKTAKPVLPAQPAEGQVARQGARVTSGEPAVPGQPPDRLADTPPRAPADTPRKVRAPGQPPVQLGTSPQTMGKPGTPAPRRTIPGPQGKPATPVPGGVPPAAMGKGQALPGQRLEQARRPQPIQSPGRPALPRAPGKAEERGRRTERPTVPPPVALPRPAPRPQLSNWAQVATAADRQKEADRRADRYAVEVHKKWSISFACISFVIIGIVMALRFPRGGIGLVIGGGLLVFAVHYIGLTAGESLADRGFVSPWAAMWTPNIVLTVIGLIGLFMVSRESGSTRGGDFQEIADGLRHLVRRVRRRRAPAAGEAV